MDEYKIQLLFENMEFFGKLDGFDFEGKSFDSSKNEIFYLQVKIKEGVILDAKYRIISNAIICAICELFTQKIIKKDIKSVFKYLVESYLAVEIGEIPQEYLYIIELYRNACKDIIIQYNQKIPKQKKEPAFKRLLNFKDEEDLDTLSDEQVKKLLNAVDDLKYDTNKDKYETFDKVKDTVMGNNDKKENILEIKKIDKSKLLDDNVPDFDYYVDNTVGLEFEDKEIKVDTSNNLTFDKDVSNNSIFEDLDLEFEKNLSFDNYKFDDNNNDKE